MPPKKRTNAPPKKQTQGHGRRQRVTSSSSSLGRGSSDRGRSGDRAAGPRRKSKSRARDKSQDAGRRRSRSRSKGKEQPRASEEQEKLWRRIEKLRRRSPRRGAADSSSSEASNEGRHAALVRELKERLQMKVKKGRRWEALAIAVKMLEKHAKIDQALLRELLEVAATKPGAAAFAAVLQVCGSARIQLQILEFAKIVGVMVQRGAPVAQVRLALNLVIPRGEPPIPLIPPGLDQEEVSAVFQDEALDEDSNAEEEAEKGDMTREAPPERLEIVGCKAHPALNGIYECDPDTTSYGRPTYLRTGGQGKGKVLYKRDGKVGTWCVSNSFGEEALLINRRDARHPPRVGWLANVSGGRTQADPAVFKALVGAPDAAAGNGQAAAHAAALAAQTPEGQRLRQEALRSAEKALSRVDPTLLLGSVDHQDLNTLEYFSHFCVLMHLELMAEVAGIRKRRQRTPREQLVRTGWALDQLPVRSIFGRREGGRRMLPGWEDPGSEMVAFVLHRGFDMERCRFMKGDCVTVSEQDPLLDRVGEGLVTDVKPGVMVVQLSGRLQDQQGKTWRLDKAANRVVYERQFMALLQLASNAEHPPCCELLVAAEVGGVDSWVESMKRGAPPGVAPKGPRRPMCIPGGSRSRSGGSGSSSTRPRGKRRRDKGRSASAKKRKKVEKPKKETRAMKIASEPPKDLEGPRVLERVDEEVGGLKDLNPSQRASVLNSLMRTCTIIQGPPGTGKTHVSVQVLRLMAKTLGASGPLLAASDSNVAVDNIAAGLQAAGVRVVRLGRPEKIRSHLDDITLEAQLQREKDSQAQEEKDKGEKGGKDRGRSRSRSSGSSLPGRRRRRNKAESKGGDDSANEAPRFSHGKSSGSLGGSQAGKGKGKGHGRHGGNGMSEHVDLEAEHAARRKQRQRDMELQQKILAAAEVVCTTTIAAGGEILSKLNFSGILVDEVAQATELSVMVPIVLRGGKAQKRLILVGDHCQLPPGIQSQEAEMRGLSLSIYGRLQRAGIEPSFLDTQYRSHPKLAQFSSEAFYKGALGSGVDSSARPLPKGIPWPSDDCPVAFVEVGSAEEAEGDSKCNTAEAQRVLHLVARVVAAKELGFEDIGIVTPYTAQVRKLRMLFRGIFPPNFDPRRLEIASVDAFQGREKELIIFSAVRCNPAGNVGFLGDWRRLNVMLTRARRGLVVFGTASTLCKDAFWDRWLKWCQANGAVQGGELNLEAPRPTAPPNTPLEPLGQAAAAAAAGTVTRGSAPVSRPPPRPAHPSQYMQRGRPPVAQEPYRGRPPHQLPPQPPQPQPQQQQQQQQRQRPVRRFEDGPPEGYEAGGTPYQQGPPPQQQAQRYGQDEGEPWYPPHAQRPPWAGPPRYAGGEQWADDWGYQQQWHGGWQQPAGPPQRWDAWEGPAPAQGWDAPRQEAWDAPAPAQAEWQQPPPQARRPQRWDAEPAGHGQEELQYQQQHQQQHQQQQQQQQQGRYVHDQDELLYQQQHQQPQQQQQQEPHGPPQQLQRGYDERLHQVGVQEQEDWGYQVQVEHPQGAQHGEEAQHAPQHLRGFDQEPPQQPAYEQQEVHYQHLAPHPPGPDAGPPPHLGQEQYLREQQEPQHLQQPPQLAEQPAEETPQPAAPPQPEMHPQQWQQLQYQQHLQHQQQLQQQYQLQQQQFFEHQAQLQQQHQLHHQQHMLMHQHMHQQQQMYLAMQQQHHHQLQQQQQQPQQPQQQQAAPPVPQQELEQQQQDLQQLLMEQMQGAGMPAAQQGDLETRPGGDAGLEAAPPHAQPPAAWPPGGFMYGAGPPAEGYGGGP